MDNVVGANDDRRVETTVAASEVYQLGLCSSKLDHVGFTIYQDVFDVLCEVLDVLLEVIPAVHPLEANVIFILEL